MPLMTDSHTLIMCREILVTCPVLARHPQSSGLLTWDNAGTTNTYAGTASPDNEAIVHQLHKQHSLLVYNCNVIWLQQCNHS